MLTTKLNKLSALSSLCLAFALGAPAARAVCPPGANTTGVGFTLTFRHQNGTPIGPEGAAPCESIQVVANVSYPNAPVGDIVEMFSGGAITLQKVLPLPAGATADITPAGGIPLIGPPGLCPTNAATVLVVQSTVFNYSITPADAAAGAVRFQANYSNGITTTGTPVGAFTQQDTFVAPVLNVTVPPPPAACVNAPITLTTTVTGGTPGAPLTYVWTNLTTSLQVGTASTFVPSTATPGTTTYQVTVRDGFGCAGSATATVTVLAAPTCTIQNVSTCAGSQSSLTVAFPSNPNGGASVVSWTRNGVTFDGGSNPLPVTVPAAGAVDTYVATIRDNAGCTSTCSATVTGLTAPTCSIVNVTTCAGSQSSLTVSFPNNPNGGAAVISWTRNGVTFDGSSNPLPVTVPAAGVVDTYVATIRDASGCTSTCTGTVTGLPAPTCSIASISACAGSQANLTLTITADLNAGAQVISWTRNGTAFGTGGPNPLPVTVPAAGVVDTYVATIRDNAGCTSTCSGTVTGLAAPTCSIVNVLTCAGSQSSLTVSFPNNPNGGAAVISWTRNGVTFDGSSNPLPVTVPAVGVVDTYVATIRDASGCTSTCTGTVTGLPAPTCSIASISACAGSQANLTLTITGNLNGGAQVISWTRNGTAFGTGGPNPLPVTVPAAGLVDTYVATIRDNAGCTSTCSGTVTGLAAPTCSIVNVLTCAGSQSSLTVSFPNNPNGGAAVISWTRNGVAFDGSSNPLPVTVPAAGAVDTYVASIRDASGCTSTCTGTVTGLPAPTCSIASISACAGSQANLTLTITGNLNGGAQVISWTRNGTTFGTGGPNPLPVTAPAAGAVDTYVATIRDNAGCTSTCSGTVTGLAAPTCSIVNVLTCPGSQSSLTVSFPNNPNGGAAVISWTRNGVTFDGSSNPLPVTVPAAGVVDTYVASIRDASGCTSTCTGTVTGLTAPTCSIQNISLCENSSGSLNVTFPTNPNGGARVVSWTKNGTTFDGGSNPLTVNAPGAGLVDTYVATITDSAGCTSTCSATVSQYPRPFVSLQPITICTGTTASLRATVDACAPTTFAWTGPDGFTATGNPINVTARGTYTVTVTDCNNCTSSATTTLAIDTMVCAVSPAFCILCNGDTQTLTASPVGGRGPFTYRWSDNSTGSTLTTNRAGIYTVTITDSLGCTSTCSAQVTVDIIACLIIPSCVSCPTLEVCNGSSLTLDGTHIGGLAPFQYVWSTGETTSSIVVTEPGVYTLQVSDGNGCVASQSVTVGGCEQCVTRDSTYWFTHVVSPPGIQLPAGTSCATLQSVFTRLPTGLMNLGFLTVNLDQALGLFWGSQSSTGDGLVRGDPICIARKQLSVELITAIANTTLLNASSAGCGVRDPNTGSFISINALIQEAQAATVAEPNTFDCAHQTAWLNEMNGITALLHSFNAGGTGLTIPSNLVACGVGFANASYVSTHQPDPTTAANCACQVP